MTTRRGFWCLHYSPHGLNPETGKRWGSTRLELGDAQVMAVTEARSAALAAKARVMAGDDPHRAKVLQRRSLAIARGILPTTVRQALDDYEKALMAIGARS